MAYTLLPVQEKALERLYRMKSAVIALMTGTGKSLTTLHLAKHLQTTEGVKTIFCIPKSARASFTKEMKTKLELPFLMINSDSPLQDISLLNNYNFIFIEFSVLGNYIDALVQLVKDNPSYIFIDEAQALCSPKSAQTTYMKMIRQHCIGCFSITATPILTDIEGLFYLYQFTFPTLKVFQSWFRFRNLYCITQDKTLRLMGKKRIIKEIVGYKNMEELNTLLDKITIKGAQEYNVEYYFLKARLENDRLEKYKLAAKGILVTEDEKEWGPRLHDLQRVVDGLPLDDEPIREYSKVRLLIDVLKQIMDRNEATLIYVEYMDTIDYLKTILENHKEKLQYHSIMTLSGKEKEEKRQQIEQNLVGRDIVIMTKAGRQCFGKGTEILMADGSIKNIEDIIVGDKVMGMDSNPRIVKEVHSGIDKLYKVHQNKSCFYIVNSQHILTLRNTVRYKVQIDGKHYEHKDILDINIEDYLNLSKYKRSVFRGFKEGFIGEFRDLPIPPYILGIWLGDGTIKRPEITINNRDISIYEEWKEYGSSLGLDATIECKRKGSFRSYLTSHVNGKINKFTELLRKVIGDHKHIPEEYLLSSRSQRLELLAGLIDTDGSKHREGLCYSTVNEDLAFAVKRLCDGLGYHTSINKKHKTNGYKETDIYILGISGYFSDLPLRVKRKIPQIRNNKTDYSASSLRIESIGMGEFYGFEVEGDPHFQLADGTVVHNSRNLQRANNLILYNTPYSIGDLLQCPCKGTKILTDKGYINVEDLEDTFNVIVHNNIYHAKKLGVKKSKVVEVVFNTGFSIRISEDHQFQDTVGDWVKVTDLFSGKKLPLDFSMSPLVEEGKYLDDFWYLIGYYIGDGSIEDRIKKNGSHSYGFHIVVPETQMYYLDKLNEILIKLGYSPRIKQLPKEKEEFVTIYNISVYNKSFLEKLKNIGIEKCNQKYRTVPTILYREPRSARIAFLQGYFDADGTKGKGTFRTCSECLAKGIQHLLMTIGMISSVRGPYKCKLNDKEFISYNINMLGDSSLIDKEYVNKSWYSNGSTSKEIMEKFLYLVHDNKRKPENVSRALTKLKYNRMVTPYQESLVRSYYYIPENISVEDMFSYYRKTWVYNTRLAQTKFDIKNSSICSKEKLRLLVKQLNLPLEVPDVLEVSQINYLPEEEDVYLITVDSDEHAYVTNNLISHNCSGRICRVDTTFDKQHFYILEVEKTIDSYRIALFKDHLALLDRLLGKECRGTLTCDYVEIDRMKLKELKKSLLWRTK